MAYPAWTVVRQGGVLQHFEAEARYAARLGTGFHRITGRGWHRAANQDRPIGENCQGFSARAGSAEDFQYSPVGCNIAPDIQAIGKSVTGISRGGDAEIAHEVLTAEWLRQDENKSTAGINRNRLDCFENRGHRRRASDIPGPAMRAPRHNSVYQLGHTEASLSPVGCGIPQGDCGGHRHQHYGLTDAIQFSYPWPAACDRCIELRAKLTPNKPACLQRGFHSSEVWICGWSMSRYQRERLAAIPAAEQPHFAETVRGGSRPIVVRKKPGRVDHHQRGGLPFDEMREACGRAIGELERCRRAIKSGPRQRSRRQPGSGGDHRALAGLPNITGANHEGPGHGDQHPAWSRIQVPVGNQKLKRVGTACHGTRIRNIHHPPLGIRHRRIRRRNPCSRGSPHKLEHLSPRRQGQDARRERIAVGIRSFETDQRWLTGGRP